MLRRKLLLNLVPLVALLFVMAVAAIWLLQGVLRGMDHVSQQGWGLLDTQREHQALVIRFRWIVMGLGVFFLVVINLSVVVLVRMAGMILRPVDRLIKATRELSDEHFAHRVTLEANDEFDELAAAYNTLAEHLQTTEKRRIEALGQMALALNHDLNNAMATIELQLGLLGRRSEDPQTERRLRTIHDSLTRMRDTVQSLKNVRRIVLTDYGQGMKMLDLVRSARDEDQVEMTHSHV